MNRVKKKWPLMSKAVDAEAVSSAGPERGWGAVVEGDGVTTCTCTVETDTSINHCLHKENRG